MKQSLIQVLGGRGLNYLVNVPNIYWYVIITLLFTMYLIEIENMSRQGVMVEGKEKLFTKSLRLRF